MSIILHRPRRCDPYASYTGGFNWGQFWSRKAVRVKYTRPCPSIFYCWGVPDDIQLICFSSPSKISQFWPSESIARPLSSSTSDDDRAGFPWEAADHKSTGHQPVWILCEFAPGNAYLWPTTRANCREWRDWTPSRCSSRRRDESKSFITLTMVKIYSELTKHHHHRV